MAHRPPGELNYDLILTPDAEIADILAVARATVAEADGFEPRQWSTIKDVMAAKKVGAGKQKGAMPEDAWDNLGADRFSEGFTIEGDPASIRVRRLSQSDLDEELGFETGIDGAWRVFDDTDSYDDAGDEAYLATVAMIEGIFRGLSERFRVLAGSLERERASYLGPEPPLAPSNALIMIVNSDAVDAAYGDAQAYWGEWDRVDYHGAGQAMVSRALGIVDEAEFKILSLTRGLALGRAAAPGMTGYYDPELEDDEEEKINEMDSYLDQVGYDADTQTLEFSAYLGADEDLTPRDILLILRFLEEGTGSGDEVETVVVTLPDKATCARQYAPLRDIGVVVQYLGDDGEWHRYEGD